MESGGIPVPLSSRPHRVSAGACHRGTTSKSRCVTCPPPPGPASALTAPLSPCAYPAHGFKIMTPCELGTKEEGHRLHHSSDPRAPQGRARKSTCLTIHLPHRMRCIAHVPEKAFTPSQKACLMRPRLVLKLAWPNQRGPASTTALLPVIQRESCVPSG